MKCASVWKMNLTRAMLTMVFTNSRQMACLSLLLVPTLSASGVYVNWVNFVIIADINNTKLRSGVNARGKQKL